MSAAGSAGAAASAGAGGLRLHGSCHCGNIRFRLDWDGRPERIDARECDCSFCRKRGGLWTSCPGGRLRVWRAEPGLSSVYRFGTGTADFQLCTRCGGVPLVSSLIDGRLHAVISVPACDDLDQSLLQVMPAHFDGESAAQRLVRRARGWIADVEFIDGPGPGPGEP